MHDGSSVQVKIRTGRKANIWLALLVALGFHIIVVFLPMDDMPRQSGPMEAQIEVELTAFKKPPEPMESPAEPKPPPVVPEPEPEPRPEPEPVPVEQLVEETPASQPAEPPLPQLTAIPRSRDLETMSEAEKDQLTNAILTRQYITEESVVDEIFGRPVSQETIENPAGFHYPVRPNLVAMLDKPLPEVPFAFTPGLVHFAYDPGVKGDLQRFWDVITPEWGFRTNYGTEVRCIWMLVIVGCGWK